MNAQPTPRRPLSLGPLVASVGAVLLIVSLFLDWYDQITGFTVFEFLDLLLVMLALATIASLADSLAVSVGPKPMPAVSLAIAIFTVLVVASQLVNDPPAVASSTVADKDVGIWLALAGSGLMVIGAVLGYARISLAVDKR
jgi:hypothetical protein